MKWSVGLEQVTVSRLWQSMVAGGFLLDLECFGGFEQLWLSWPSGMADVGLGAGEAALSPHSRHRTFLKGFQCLAEIG